MNKFYNQQMFENYPDNNLYEMQQQQPLGFSQQQQPLGFSQQPYFNMPSESVPVMMHPPQAPGPTGMIPFNPTVAVPVPQETPPPAAPEKPPKTNSIYNTSARNKLHLRKAAGSYWIDTTLNDWSPDDYRVFCGDLGNEVTDELLSNTFRHYRSFQRARVIRDKRTGKGKGYGFVSFRSPEDMLRAIKEMDRKYVGKRPIRVMKSKWKDRELDSEQNKRGVDLTIALGAKGQKKYCKYTSKKSAKIVAHDFSAIIDSKKAGSVAFWPYGKKV